MKVRPDPESPAQLRGGGAFNFEDLVAATFLADLLAGERRFLPSIHGRVQAVDRQAGAPPMDDVRLTLKDGDATSFLAFSVKRNRQVTGNGFPSDFVRAVWSRWLNPGTGERAFVQERDHLGLAVGLLSNEVRESWDSLLGQALTGDPHELAQRFCSGSVSRMARDLFESLHCPEDLQGAELCDATERVRLLRRIRLLYFDFRSDPSVDFSRAVEVCRRALASGRFDEALDLWERLVGITAEMRPGGFLDLGVLLGRLHGKFRLVALPDYREDWERLKRTSEDALGKVKESLGLRITLLRPERLREIGQRLAPGRRLLLVGVSGSGKSALAKIAARRWREGPALWLDSTGADVQGLFALQQRLHLANSLADLFRDTLGQGLLVFDALETWSPQALNVAAGLLKLCASLSNWTVLMTIRPDHQRSLLPNLQRDAELSSGFESLSVPLLGDGELRGAREALVGLDRLFLRRDLKELLRKLKVLDWLVVFASGQEPEAPGWMKVSEVVDGLWNHWIGNGEDKWLRGELIKRLALREAETLRPGIGFSELGPEEVKTLPRLVEELELLNARDDQVFFQHELVGDWARLRILIERAGRGSLAADLAGFARSPRWPPAIRLFGERLLEQETAARWCALYDGLPKGPGVDDARGVLLESLFWAANADEALESLWPRLMADGGDLLKRLLQRFLYSATVPDPGTAKFAEDEQTAAGLRAMVRIPYPPLWKPVLETLDAHRDEVATIAPELGAEVCGLWLRVVPREWPWRTEAARVALGIAREIQQGGARTRKLGFEKERKQDQKVYEAALWGARELPGEVTALALALSRRKEEPSDSQKRIEKTRRSPAGLPSFASLGAWKWPPFPDGPRKAVNEGFRAAVLESQALSSLIQCRPKIAREVLLACCLQAPGVDVHTRSLGTMERFGWQGSSAPMFFRGPFLQFLRLDAEHGLDTILRLVNQATSNWAALLKHEARYDLGPASIEARSSWVPWGEMEGWEGDGEVYSWYRQHISGSVIVTSALMALEKWLYELIDEGRDLRAVLARIFAESRSIALTGVLVALGKRTPELFAGQLLPLLSAWPLYLWDSRAIERNNLYRAGPWELGIGERVFEMVQDWHLLPHRCISLLDIACDLLLKNPHVANALEVARERWREQLRSEADKIPVTLERLVALFDPANYRSSEVTSFEWPEHLREKSEQEPPLVEPGVEIVAFREWCHSALQERTPLTPENSGQVWQALGELDRLTTKEEVFSGWTEAMVAGIAVLLDLSHDWITVEWLSWCRERLSAILGDPCSPDILDDGSILPSLVTISGVLLLAIDGSDLLARQIVAEQIVNLRENRIALILRYGFRERQRLGGDWGRMQSLAVFGAALRSVGKPAVEPKGDFLHYWASRLARWFVQRKLQPKGPSWGKIARVALRLRERLYQKEVETRTAEFAPQRFPPVWGVEPGFDLSALEAAFAWLPRLEEAYDENERAEWIHLHRELLWVAVRMRQALERLGADADAGWDSGLLSEYERWLSPYLARLIPQLATAEERRSFWESAFQSFSGAETFMNAWFLEGLQAAGTPDNFMACWEEMILYALSSPDLDLDMSHLLGMGWIARKVLSEESRPALRRFIPLFEQWTQQGLRSARNVQRLASFLLRPAALDFVCPGIQWLRGALPKLKSRIRDEEEERLDHALVDVLRTGWARFQSRIRADSALLNDFQDLLSWLAGRGGAAALDLQEEVRRSLSASS
jgi:hypothetical protein